MMKIAAATVLHVIAGVVSGAPSASPVLSAVSDTARFSWEIPQGGLGPRSSFYTVSPANVTVFIVFSGEMFNPLPNYRDRLEYQGDIAARNVTFTLNNIQTSDAGTYTCGNGGATTVIQNCGQKLVVLGKPTTPGRPVSTTSVYNQQVTLTCSSTSTTVPADHGLTLTYTWQRDNTDITVTSPGSPYTFTVSSRDSHSYRCRARESQGLESEWSEVYNMEPQYGPYQISLTPSTTSYTVTELQALPSITCSALCRPGCSFRWLHNGTAFSSGATLSLGQADRSETGSYRCQPSNTHGSGDSVTVSVDVQYGPYQISLTPSTTSYTVTELQALPSITCSALCRPGCSYRWLHNGTTVSSGATLSLGQADRSETGSYRCQPYNTHGSGDSVTVSVDVQYPAEVVLETQGSATCRPYRVYVGQQNVEVTCRVTSANPAVTSYTWTHNSSVIQSARGAVFTIGSVSRTDGGSYTCQGSNSLGGSTSSPVTLEVQYGPSVSVAASTQTVTEGQTLTVTCSVDSIPAATVTWTRKDGSSFTPQTGSTLTISNIQRSQTGTYVCTATNTLSPCGGPALPRSESREMTVDVQYPATVSMFTANSGSGSVTVNESDPVTLRCQVDSNPRSVIRLLNGTEELTRADNSLTAEYRLESADCRQRGNYSCTATNNIGATVSKRVELLVKCSPRLDETLPQQLKYASRLGGNVNVSVSVLAYPLPTFTWSRTTSTSQDLTGSSSPVSDISVTARLHLTNIQQQDLGNYSLTVDNGGGGSVAYTLKIVSEGPPSTPTNVSVYPEGPFSLHVSWEEEFNGGATQTFTVEYSTDEEDWKTAGSHEETGRGNYLTSVIRDLMSGTLYYVKVVASNKFGNSSYTEHVTGRTEKKVEPPPPPAGLIGGVAGGVGVVLLVVIVMVVIVVIRRRRTQGEDTERITSKGRGKDTNDKLEMKNDIYESADRAEMQDNVCYASSDEVMKPGASGSQGAAVSDVYAAVDKKKLKPVSKPNEVYTEVHKPGNKKAKKQGAKKDKAKKVGPKDDKTPLKSKKKRERTGEAYENTGIGDEGNPYINHGFDDQPENATGPAAVPMGAKSGRDEDGLLYVGIDFSNYNPSPYVDREEESTEYAGIQIGVVGPAPKEEEKNEEEK